MVVLLEGGVEIEVQALRRALGDPDVERVRPHITLVPPLRLADAELEAGLALLFGAARRTDPFSVALDAPDTFAPVSPTLHLPVVDGAGQLAALRSLVFRPPLERETHPFVAHVTLLAHAAPERIEAARSVLAGYRATAAVHRLTMMVRGHDADGTAKWAPAADVELDGVRVVGGGPLAVHLHCGTVLDPAAVALLDAHGVQAPPAALVVIARREGAVVGAAWGVPAQPSPAVSVFVDPGRRGQGIGTQLRREWEFRAARGSEAPPAPDRPVSR